MLRIVKKSPVWEMDANGHTLDVRFFREVKRNGATEAQLSQEQWKGYFGAMPVDAPKIDGVPVRVNATLAPDEVRFYDEGALVAVMRRLYVVPPEE